MRRALLLLGVSMFAGRSGPSRGLALRPLLLAMLSAAMIGGGLVAPAAAATPTVRWDSDGMAEVSAPPFTFGFELVDYTDPAEIDQRAIVRVELSAEVDGLPCAATVKATPLQDGIPVGEPSFIDATDYDYVSLPFPVSTAGTYSVQIEASVETGSPSCLPGSTVVTPYATTIDLFTIPADLPGPASARRVTITSSGSHTLVANTWGRSAPIRITFSIRDPEKRTDLLHSICMQDTSDCWFDDAALKPKPWAKKTATGWIRTWDFWWERSSPAECLDYYWNQPDVSVILVVSNRDGKVIGRKKHVVKLTCRR